MNKYTMASGHQAIVIYKPDLIRIITRHIPHATIYLFNGHSLGLSSQPSDVDLAIDAGYEIDQAVIDAICADIDALELHFFIDVVDIGAVYAELRGQIQAHGVVWKV
jgi:hypothetical protein